MPLNSPKIFLPPLPPFQNKLALFTKIKKIADENYSLNFSTNVIKDGLSLKEKARYLFFGGIDPKKKKRSPIKPKASTERGHLKEMKEDEQKNNGSMTARGMISKQMNRTKFEKNENFKTKKKTIKNLENRVENVQENKENNDKLKIQQEQQKIKLKRLKSIYMPRKSSLAPMNFHEYLEKNNLYSNNPKTPREKTNLSEESSFYIWDDSNLLINKNDHVPCDEEEDFLKFLKLRIEQYPETRRNMSKEQIVNYAKNLLGNEKFEEKDFKCFEFFRPKNDDLNFLKFKNLFFRNFEGGRKRYDLEDHKKKEEIDEYRLKKANIENIKKIQEKKPQKPYILKDIHIFSRESMNKNGLYMTPEFEKIFGKHRF